MSDQGQNREGAVELQTHNSQQTLSPAQTLAR